MSENVARNMYSSQGIINYPTRLHLVGHFPILYHDARKHEYQTRLCTLVCPGQELKPTFQPGCKPLIELSCLKHVTYITLYWGTRTMNDKRYTRNTELSTVFSSFKQTQQSAAFKARFWKGLQHPLIFDVRKSMHHLMFQINQPTRCNSFTSLLLDVRMWLNTFRASPRPSSGACNCTRSLRFYRWKKAAGALLVVVWPDHDQQRPSHFLPTVEQEAPSAVACSWWRAGRRPKHVEPHTNVE